MFLIFARRRPEPSERVDDLKWYGCYGGYLTRPEAEAHKANMLRPNGNPPRVGYADVRICEVAEQEAKG